MKFTTFAAAFTGLATFVHAAPVVPASEELQTIQSDIKHLNSDVTGLLNSLNLNQKAQKDLASGHESDELIAELGRSLLEASKGNSDVLSLFDKVAKRDVADGEIVGAIDASKRGDVVTIQQHTISIDVIIQAIEYVVFFNHPLPNPDHFHHVLSILGIDVETAAQINITYDTVTVDFCAILVKLIDIGHEVADLVDKVITVTINNTVIEIEKIFKAIEYICVLGHSIHDAVHYAEFLAILGIDATIAHSIGIWPTTSNFEVTIILFKYVGLGFIGGISKRGDVVNIQQHTISIDVIFQAIEYVVLFNHPLPNPDHFHHVLSILGIDVETAAQINITYDTVTVDFCAILVKLIDIGHEVADIVDKVITVTIQGVVIKIEKIFKAIEFLCVLGHSLWDAANYAAFLAILGIDVTVAHAIGIWPTTSNFQVTIILFKYIGFGFLGN